MDTKMRKRRELTVNLLMSSLLVLTVSQSPGVCTSPGSNAPTTLPPASASAGESLPTVVPVYNGTAVVTGCGHNLTLQAPPPLADGQVLGPPIVLVLNLSHADIGKTLKCSWLIHTPSQDMTGSLFTLRSSSSSFTCFDDDYDDREEVHVKILGVTKGRSCYGNGFKVAGLKELFVEFFSRNITRTSVTIGSYRAFTVTKDYCGNASSPLLVDDVERSVVFNVTDPAQAFVIHRHCQWTLKTKPTFATIFLTVQMPAFEQGQNMELQRYYIIVNTSDPQPKKKMYFRGTPVSFSLQIWENEGVISLVDEHDQWISNDERSTYVPVTPAVNFTYKAAPYSDFCSSSPKPLNASGLADGLITLVNLDGGSSSRECLWRVTAPASDMVVKLELGGRRCWETNDTLELDNNSAVNVCELQRCYYPSDNMDDSSDFKICNYGSGERYPLWSEEQTTLVRYRPTAGGNYSYHQLKYRAVRKAQGCQGHPDRRVALSGRWQQLVWTTTDVDFYCRVLLSVSSTGMVVTAEITMDPGREFCGAGVRGYDGTTVDPGTGLNDRCDFRPGSAYYVSTSGNLLLVYDPESSQAYYGDRVNDSKVVISYKAVSAAARCSSTALDLAFAHLVLLLALQTLVA